MVVGYALAKAHGRNIDRYHRLLSTHLSDVERSYIETRLLAERSALHALEEADHEKELSRNS